MTYLWVVMVHVWTFIFWLNDTFTVQFQCNSLKLGVPLYIDLFYLHSCVPFSIFHNGFVSLSQWKYFWSYKNKCIIFTLFCIYRFKVGFVLQLLVPVRFLT